MAAEEKILLKLKRRRGESIGLLTLLVLPQKIREVWWQMSEGRHKISAADAFGNSAHVWITVISGKVKEPEEELPILEEVE